MFTLTGGCRLLVKSAYREKITKDRSTVTHLEQNLLSILELDLPIEAVELDVRSPGEQDEEEAAAQDGQNDRQEALDGAEHEPLDRLKG